MLFECSLLHFHGSTTVFSSFPFANAGNIADFSIQMQEQGAPGAISYFADCYKRFKFKFVGNWKECNSYSVVESEYFGLETYDVKVTSNFLYDLFCK